MKFDKWTQWRSLDSCISMSIHCLCFRGVESQPLVDDGFTMGLSFATGFPEAFSSSWIGMASLTILSTIPFTILIQDSVYCKLLCPRLVQIVHCFNFKPASEHCLDNFWSSYDVSNRCSYSCNRRPCRSSLACNSARGSCVKISCLSSWPDATGFPGALRPTGNSAIISATVS